VAPVARLRASLAAGGGNRGRILLVAGVLAVLAVLAVAKPAFYTSTNLDNVGQLTAILGMVVLGQLVVMLAGGIDLSVGATTGITLAAVASISHGSNGRLLLAVLACLGIGVAIGALNAGLVVVRRVPPFVATLGTMIVIQGVVTAWTGGALQGAVPGALRSVSDVQAGPVSIALGIFVVLALALAWVLARTVYGRRLYAVGLNDQASRYSGITVGWVRAATYVVSALMAVVGGLLLAAYAGYVDQYAGQDLHLQSIAAAVVGGVSLAGGRGSVRGAIGGAVLLTVVLDIGLLSGLDTQTQSIITGGVLLIAAFAYGYRVRSAR
jgi:ribose/xylose/arabinose/galactoside ABC-type transport system permease subunit